MPPNGAPAGGTDGVRQEVLPSPPGRGHGCHAASLLRTRRGSLLASWYVYPEEEHRDARLAIARRRGAGNWELLPSPGPFSSSAGNPVLFETGDGRIGLLFVLLGGRYWDSAQLHATFSSEDAQAWSAPRRLWPKPGLMVRHPPLELRDSSLLLPAYDERQRRSVLLHSTAEAEHWTEVHRFDDLPLIQPALVRDASDRLTALFRPTGDPRRIWRSFSSDEGRRWASPVQTTLPTPLSGVDVCRAAGGIAAIYNHTEEHRRHPLSVSTSPDGGVTWTPPWHIDSTPEEVSYPSFTDEYEGRIDGVYTAGRRAIKYVSLPVDRLRQRGGPHGAR